ncbi:transposase [Aliikangiella sp. IMCC44359]|uniref:transposase n=1 Tax=Aliikangiella sp. IMCC44359 TaxID=3459125 RepID=UPI00403AE4D3
MTRARKTIIDLETTPYYHCISRCVRRAFLCGEDHFSGQSYEHRRDWIVERLAYLASTFAIEIASYAVMSNHYHLVLRVDVDKAKSWSEANIIRRWKRIYQIPTVVQQYLNNPQAIGIREVAQDIIEEWRKRLSDISWLMRCLNEYLACKANKEDNCKGRFWEGRFKSQPLLDESAVLTAMSYVDLNPIRAKIAKNLQQSDYTSIQQRITQLKKHTKPVIPLMKLSTRHQSHPNSFSFTTQDYCQLIDWLGRAIRNDKRGYIQQHEPPILQKLNIDSEGFIQLMKQKDDLSQLTVMGSSSTLTHYLEKLENKFIKGINLNRKVFS